MRVFCGLPYEQLLRFLIVGICNTALGYILFWLGLWLFGNLLPARETITRSLAYGSSYCICVFWGYYWQSKITFRVDPRHNLLRTVSRFILAQALLAVLGGVLLEAGVQASGLSPKVVWFGATAIVIALSYLLQKFWVFR
jgi:putative flippase GtrA